MSENKKNMRKSTGRTGTALTLYIDNIVLDKIKIRASRNNRSISQEVCFILKNIIKKHA